MKTVTPPQSDAETIPRAVAWVWPLFLSTAGLWVVFGAIGLARFGPSTGTWIVAGLMLANAALLLFVGWGVRRGRYGFFYMALAVLGINMLLTVTDQFGLFDLIYLVVAGTLFVLLLFTRRYYV
jgi:hypothetical protein